jgi:hypothetical protein
MVSQSPSSRLARSPKPNILESVKADFLKETGLESDITLASKSDVLSNKFLFQWTDLKSF